MGMQTRLYAVKRFEIGISNSNLVQFIYMHSIGQK